MTNTNQRRKRSKRTILAVKIGVGMLFVAAIAVSGVYIFYETQPNAQEGTTSDTPSKEGFGQGKGGNPTQMTSYNDQAVAAWKAGDKEKAKELAQKGVETGSKLTSKQMKQVPNSIEVSYNLQVMSEGEGPSR